MPHEFRFLVICLAASMRTEDGHTVLSGVVNDLSATKGQRVDLAAIVGAILRPEMKGKSLDLMAWRLDKTGARQRLPGYAGTPLVLPNQLGPAVLPYSISMPVDERGIYGFELFDRDGAFGPRLELLATYMFSVEVAA